MTKTYGTLARAGESGWRLSDVPPNVAVMLKRIFTRIAKADPGPWHFDNTPATCADLVWFTTRYPMAMGDRDRASLVHGLALHERNQGVLEDILSPAYQPPDRPGLVPGQALRHYQQRSTELLGTVGGQLNGDLTGLGKTFSAAGACLLPGALPAAIVTEAHTQTQWLQRLNGFVDLDVVPVTTTRPMKQTSADVRHRPIDLPQADIYLFRYSNIASWVDWLAQMRIGLIAWDEVQQLRRGIESQKGAASKAIADLAAYRLGLSATPIYGYGREIYEIMQFIDPSVLHTRAEFKREWLTDDERLTDPDALGAHLKESHVFVRRTRADVGRELPTVNRFPEYVDIDRKVLDSVDKLARELAIKATQGTFTERGQATRDLDALMRHRTGVAKAPMVAQYARLMVEAGEPIVMAGWHRDVYDIWLDELADLNPAMYTGSETAKQKTDSERRFLAGETDILIMSLRSGTGLDTLQYRAQTILLGELDWSPQVHNQLIDRLNRERTDGVVNKVMAVFLVADMGADPPMLETLGLKASEAHGVIDPGLAPAETNTSREGMRALINRYLSKGSVESDDIVWEDPKSDTSSDQPTQPEIAEQTPRHQGQLAL